MKHKKGQAITGLIILFILIAVFSILARPLFEIIEIGINASVNVTNGDLMTTLFNLLPVFILLIILVVGVALLTGRQA